MLMLFYFKKLTFYKGWLLGCNSSFCRTLLDVLSLTQPSEYFPRAGLNKLFPDRAYAEPSKCSIVDLTKYHCHS